MITAIITLGIIALAELIAFIGYVYLTNKEKAKLLNAVMSKTSQDFINVELADKVKIETPKQEPPDLVPIEDVSDEEYLKIINN